MNTFAEDLQRGVMVERLVLEMIQRKYPSATLIAAHHGYDIWIPEVHKSVEVKYDPMSNETGNILIEFEFNNRASGLFATTADYWVFYDGKTLAWCTPVDLLKYIALERLKHAMFTATGDSKPKRCFFAKKKDLFGYCERVSKTRTSDE